MTSLSEQVALIMAQAQDARLYRHKSSGRSADFSHYDGNDPFALRPGTVRVESEPAQLLAKLYAGTAPSDRPVFVTALRNSMTRANAGIGARTSLAIGHDDAFSSFDRLDEAAAAFWAGTALTMRYEPELVSPSAEAKVRAAAAKVELKARIADASRKQAASSLGSYTGEVVAPGLRLALEHVLGLSQRLRYEWVAKTIREGPNPAVEADRLVLKSRLAELGLSEALLRSSDEAAHRALTAVTEVDVKIVMDLVRAFLEEFVEEAAHKIQPKVGTVVPAGPKVNHFRPYRDYLANAGLMAHDESELIQSLYNFISNHGSHKLATSPEKLRVSHLMVIEMALLISGRIVELMAEPEE